MDFQISNLTGAFSAALPFLGPFDSLRVLGSGFSSMAVETLSGLVLCVARTEQAGMQYARAAAALPVLAGYVPVAVPQPVVFLPSAPGLPFGVLGYTRLPGSALEMPQARALGERLAEQISAVLLALQSIPPERLPWRDDFSARWRGWQDLYQAVAPVLRAEFTAAEARRLEQWWQALLTDARMAEYTPVVQHGDLWFGNLLVEGERVCALIDFETVDVGDPAQDFCTQLYLGEAFLRRVIDGFQAAGGVLDGGFDHRLEMLWGLREFGGLRYAVDHDDRVEFAESLEKIRKGPILNRRGLDGWGS